MDGHLVAVKVSVERGADERVDLDGFALYQNRLERLYAQAVQCRSPVQQYRVLADDFFQNIPDNSLLALNHLFGLLYGRRVIVSLSLVGDVALEQLERHRPWQAALVESELRADDDYRAARIVDAFAEQVLTEAALLAFQGVR